MALRDLALFNDCLSRLCYALFHAMVALLLTEGIEPRRHRALGHLLAAHLSSVLSPSEIAAVGRAATYRDLADYERAWNADEATVQQAFAEIDGLIARAKAHLVAGGWAPS